MKDSYSVYIKTDTANRITAINSDAFLPSTDGWTKIDESWGDRYHHAQGNYFPDSLYDDRGICRYKLVDGKPAPRTQEEMDGDYGNESIIAEVRRKRNALLAECDWTQVLDAPIDDTTREAYRVYRQALRDVPEQPGFPYRVDWPEPPTVTKAAPTPIDTAIVQAYSEGVASI